MKVNVTRKTRPIQWEIEFEKLFQENKNLRIYVGHLRDELNIVQQQSEVRRQKMAEKDALIEELNDQITAQEEELKDARKHSARLAEVCSQRDNFEASYKQVTQWWGKEQARAEEYHIALIERDCQVEELEEQLKQTRNENEEWAQIAANQREEKEALENVIHAFEKTRKEYEEEIHAQHVEKREWMQKYEELKAQKEADDKKCEETCIACNERYEEVLSDRNHLRKEVAQLTSKLETLQNAYNLQKENATINYDTLLVYTKELERKNANLESALNEAHANLETAADASSDIGELEEQLDHYKKAAIIWQEKAEAIQECREDAEARLRDVSNRFIVMYQENVDKEKEAREVIADLRDELNDRNTRIDELEKRIEWLQNERQLYENNVARLTNERDTAVNENTEMMFEINELQDKLEAEHDLRVEAEKEYDKVASEAYNMHKKIAELTIDNTRLENKVEELSELEADYDALVQTKREYGEEIDRLRKVVTNLQSTRFTTDEFIRMITRELMPSTDK